jgi:hypothetical protein
MKFVVHAGESHIRHLIEFTQFRHHPAADFAAGYCAFKVPLDALAHIVDQAVDLFRIKGAFVAGVFDTAAQLISVKIFAFAVAFDYFKLALDDTFVGTEPVSALQTLAAAAHAEPLFDHPRINHFVILKTAYRTPHKTHLSLPQTANASAMFVNMQ